MIAIFTIIASMILVGVAISKEPTEQEKFEERMHLVPFSQLHLGHQKMIILKKCKRCPINQTADEMLNPTGILSGEYERIERELLADKKTKYQSNLYIFF